MLLCNLEVVDEIGLLTHFTRPLLKGGGLNLYMFCGLVLVPVPIRISVSNPAVAEIMY